MSGKSNILIAAVGGLAVGIGIGMLIAPEKGSKTRKKIRKKILDIADKLEGGFPTTFEELQAVLSSDKEEEEPEKDERENLASDAKSI
jgi:gas vesicle protein